MSFRIYKIYHPDNPLNFYVGSTSKTLKQRLKNHLSAYRVKCGSFPYLHAMFKKYGSDKIIIQKIKIYKIRPNETMADFDLRKWHTEAKWMNKLNPSLNKNRPFICDEKDPIKRRKIYMTKWLAKHDKYYEKWLKLNPAYHKNWYRKNKNRHVCNLCNYSTGNKFAYNNHTKCKKHLRMVEISKESAL